MLEADRNEEIHAVPVKTIEQSIAAVAKKLARIVWAVWRHQRPFAADYRSTITTQTATISTHQEDGTELT